MKWISFITLPRRKVSTFPAACLLDEALNSKLLNGEASFSQQMGLSDASQPLPS
jgi:hypothetical protein